MATSAPASVAVVDVLNSLLEAEQNSVFRFMGEGSPYLSRATAEVRKPLQEMVDASHRHAELLNNAIDALGGVPLPRAIQPEEQYLAFLSLKFLLPKLVREKRLAIERYENALGALKKGPTSSVAEPAEVISLLRQLLAEHRSHLSVLEEAAARVIAASASGA